MTVPAIKSASIPKLMIFEAGCEARAILYAARELDLHGAVDVLHAAAVDTDLVKEIGQGEVQR
jgi:hypothetical protein